MGIIGFKGRAKANRWKEDLAALNNETDQVLRNVADCIKEIQTESSGDFVTELVETGANLAAAAVDMIKNMKRLEDLIENLIQLLIQKIAEATQEVANDRSAGTDIG